MKTLDEVIAYFDNQTQQRHVYLTEDAEDIYNDALHYLKEYRMQLDDIVAKWKVLEYKTAQYEQMCETIQKQGQEHEDRLQAEIARYVEAVKSCEEAENKYKALQIGFIRATADLEDNPPLDWEQLKQMEGKPVWVKESAENGLWWTYWVIWQGDNAILPKKDYSTKWQAYRKERS